jgi:preprotein translocase subunit YajC
VYPLIFIVVIFALMWLLFIRPQRAKQQAQRDLIAGVGPGDEIITAGGLYGTVRGVDDEVVTLEIAPDTEVRVAKRAIATVIRPEDELAEDEEPDEEEEEAEADGELEADAADEQAREPEPADAVAQGESTSDARR